MKKNTSILFATLAGLLLLQGCGSAKRGIGGEVTIDNASVARGQITFINLESNLVCKTEVLNGKYRFSDNEVTPGNYQIKVSVNSQSKGEGSSHVSEYRIEDREIAVDQNEFDLNLDSSQTFSKRGNQ